MTKIHRTLLLVALAAVTSIAAQACAGTQTLTLKNDELSGSLSMSGTSGTLTIDHALGGGQPSASTALEKGWDQIIASPNGPYITLLFNDYPAADDFYSTGHTSLLDVELGKPTYDAATDSLIFPVTISAQPKVTETDDALAKIAQSDVPDNMLALLTALRASNP